MNGQIFEGNRRVSMPKRSAKHRTTEAEPIGGDTSASVAVASESKGFDLNETLELNDDVDTDSDTEEGVGIDEDIDDILASEDDAFDDIETTNDKENDNSDDDENFDSDENRQFLRRNHDHDSSDVDSQSEETENGNSKSKEPSCFSQAIGRAERDQDNSDDVVPSNNEADFLEDVSPTSGEDDIMNTSNSSKAPSQPNAARKINGLALFEKTFKRLISAQVGNPTKATKNDISIRQAESVSEISTTKKPVYDADGEDNIETDNLFQDEEGVHVRKSNRHRLVVGVKKYVEALTAKLRDPEADQFGDDEMEDVSEGKQMVGKVYDVDSGTFKSLSEIFSKAPDNEEYLVEKQRRKQQIKKKKKALQDRTAMDMVSSDTDTSDEEHSRNTVGNIPTEWYNEYDHIGYDRDGKKVRFCMNLLTTKRKSNCEYYRGNKAIR